MWVTSGEFSVEPTLREVGMLAHPHEPIIIRGWVRDGGRGPPPDFIFSIQIRSYMMETDLFQAALNLQSPWNITKVNFSSESRLLELWIDFIPGSEFDCPKCSHHGCKGYDTEDKTWRHLNFFQYRCDLHCRVPRVKCPNCGVILVDIPWARKRSGFSLLMESLILIMAKDMPISKVASLLGEDDGRIWRVVDHYVSKARENEDYSNVQVIGFDETSSRRGHNYITIAVDLESSTVIFATEGKDHTTVDQFVPDFINHSGNPENITDVCSDLSKAYIKGVRENFPNAVHTYDKFHVMKLVGEALDEVRKTEQQTDPILRKTRYLWLKNRDSLSQGEENRFNELSKMNLKTARAYRMKEALKVIWDCPDIQSAKELFNKWYFWATHCKLEPMIKLAKALKRHESGILNIVKSRISNGIVEAINGKIQMLKRSGRGYPNIDNFITMIYLRCGKLSLNLPT